MSINLKIEKADQNLKKGMCQSFNLKNYLKFNRMIRMISRLSFNNNQIQQYSINYIIS